MNQNIDQLKNSNKSVLHVLFYFVVLMISNVALFCYPDGTSVHIRNSVSLSVYQFGQIELLLIIVSSSFLKIFFIHNGTSIIDRCIEKLQHQLLQVFLIYMKFHIDVALHCVALYLVHHRGSGEAQSLCI